MRTYIHDPDFEADFIDSDIEDMSLGEKMSVMTEQFNEYQQKKIQDYESDYTSAFLRDLRDLLDDAEFEDEEIYRRESIYMMFKALSFPVCVEYLKTHQSFAQLCKWKAVEILDVIDEFELDSLWNNTKIAVVDFLYLDEVKDL
jgi:hypothetical protein